MWVCAKCGHQLMKTTLLDFTLYQSLEPLPPNVTLPSECVENPRPMFGPTAHGKHEPMEMSL